jgi:signal transduction histidine kinase
MRIVLPVLLALGGVAALATVQTVQAAHEANDAERARTLAGVTAAMTALGHQVVAEFRLTSAPRPDDPPDALAKQRAATDATLHSYEATGQPVLAQMPDVTVMLREFSQALRGLDQARQLATNDTGGAAAVDPYYDQIMVTLVRLAGTLPTYMSDKHLIELSQSLVTLTNLDYLGARQLSLISQTLATGQIEGRARVTLATWVGAEGADVDGIRAVDPVGRLHTILLRQPQVGAAVTIRQHLLDSPSGRSVADGPQAWWTGQTRYLDGLRDIQTQVVALLLNEANALVHQARQQAVLIATIAVAIALLSLGGAGAVAARIGRRLQRARAAALTTARAELPAAIAALTATRDPADARRTLAQTAANLDALLVDRPDEIGALADALGTVQRQALRLAADQAILHIDVEATFRALSRRGQTLVQRQIHLLDEFSRDEADPSALGRFFALDHLAARMRRNEENLLVLAGGEPGRWITRPVSTHDVIRAAAQEIEEYRRVHVDNVIDLAVAARFAGDTIHLLAELLENATNFSPPDSLVRVSTRRTPSGLVVAVVDSGIGMSAPALGAANERLANPGSLNSSLVGTMGLLVVARLAQRLGIRVRLDSAPATGTTASILLPPAVLTAPVPEQTPLQAGRPTRTDPDVTLPTGHQIRGVEYRGLTGVKPPVTMPDPEDVRDRLSSLAAGIAAAGRSTARAATDRPVPSPRYPHD